MSILKTNQNQTKSNSDFNPKYLLNSVQHRPSSIPWLGRLPHAVKAGHTVPLPVLKLPIEGVCQHQNAIIQVEIGHLMRENNKIK